MFPTGTLRLVVVSGEKEGGLSQPSGLVTVGDYCAIIFESRCERENLLIFFDETRGKSEKGGN